MPFQPFQLVRPVHGDSDIIVGNNRESVLLFEVESQGALVFILFRFTTVQHSPDLHLPLRQHHRSKFPEPLQRN